MSSQIGVWTVERIFDIGAFTVLMVIDVFFAPAIRSNPYLDKFRLAALVLCAMVAFMALVALLIRKRGHQAATFLHRVSSSISTKLAHHVDQKVRAFGEGLNTIASAKSFLKLVAISLVMWFMIALAYRQVAHAYPPEPAPGVAAEEQPPSVDVETAKLADLPELAGQELTDDTVDTLRSALHDKGYSLKRERNGTSPISATRSIGWRAWAPVASSTSGPMSRFALRSTPWSPAPSRRSESGLTAKPQRLRRCRYSQCVSATDSLASPMA